MPEFDGPTIERFYRAVGLRVREARTSARMTQAQLAEELGLTRSSVANVEAGRQRTPLHVFAMIAEALDVDPAKLLPQDLTAPEKPDLSNLDEHLADADESSRDFVQSALAPLMDDPDTEE
ncbi:MULTISPECIES: helix-turn-helix transcriptional regulator [unclassified Streptomyces]|uniref:helix-turn-helix domain-containing protein n=1 Tax=unclassified Streptomyces TaxID=2593676 RepID=UPI000FFE85BA|nr:MULTISPECIES: helix-turn-helix transcriptional regulator [unclassified Streptomyces]